MRAEWGPDELIEAWTLTGGDWDLIANKAGATRQGTSYVRNLESSPEGYVLVEMDDDNVFVADPEHLQSLHGAQQSCTPVRYWINNFQRVYGQPRGGLVS